MIRPVSFPRSEVHPIRSRCAEADFEVQRLIPFSCKGRGTCPSCNARRMCEVAAHLTDHVLPHVPAGQWVLSVPKRLRPYLHHDVRSANLATPSADLAHGPSPDALVARRLYRPTSPIATRIPLDFLSVL